MSADGLARLASLTLPEVIQTEGNSRAVLHPSLAGLSGRHQVLVRLRGMSVAESGKESNRPAVLAEQAAFIDRAAALAPSLEVLATAQLALNAVVLDVDAADLPALSRDTSVTRVVGVANYSHDLSETVPYIGASTAHAVGAKGAGVRVAVIDSGVDYTHANLGGPGTQAAYEAAWAPLPVPPAPAIPALTSGGYLVIDDPATAADDGLFPSAKVVGGYDFVGESWPNTALQPDPDPIAAPDATTFGGHGTHVADIIGGKGGVAPGVQIYAVKACSAPATSCSGIALIQSMEFALDPNGDGRMKDKVDIINMSLGSIYGQPFDDDLSAAVDNAAKVGVMTVASAGNSADKQFITGSPGAASYALSVAQTAVPSAALQIMNILAPVVTDRGAVFQPWSAPLTTTIQGQAFVAGPTSSAKRLGCNNDATFSSPYAPGELAGRIVFVDRGICSFSIKNANVAAAGGILTIIGVVTADAPFAGAFGGPAAQPIPAFMISNADAAILRPGNATVRFSPSGNVSLAGSLASTSSRGPRFDDNVVKPEIGAPGASVSASSGSFTGAAAFGGTSGAAPMVTGAAAILKGARPNLSIQEIKQILVNTADTNVRQPSVAGSVFPDQLAPITRIGGGEVRVDKALFSPVLVRDVTGDPVSKIHGAMSFGLLDQFDENFSITRKLRVENKSGGAQTYSVTPTLRYADDAATGAVSMTVTPSSVSVPAGGSADVSVKLAVKGLSLRNNLMSAGAGGNAIGPLTANEYDGYIVFQGSDHKVTMPWHILPRKVAKVKATLPGGKLKFDETGLGTVSLLNKGIGTAQIFAYSLLATGTDRPGGAHGEQTPNPDLRAVATNTFLVPAGTCGAAQNFIWEFAFNMHERKANPAGTWHEVDIDTTGDGLVDFFIINQDVGGVTALSDGRQVTAVINAVTGVGTLRFFVEHATNSSNVILRVCGSDLGLTTASIGLPMTADFRATSWYFGGDESHLGPFAITPFGEEFTASVPGDAIAYQATADLTVQQWGLFPGTSPYAGVLLVTNSDFGAASRGAATADTEGLILPR